MADAAIFGSDLHSERWNEPQMLTRLARSAGRRDDVLVAVDGADCNGENDGCIACRN